MTDFDRIYENYLNKRISDQRAKNNKIRANKRVYSKKYTAQYPDAYIKVQLKIKGFHSHQITSELIEIYRLQLKTKREIKKLTT